MSYFSLHNIGFARDNRAFYNIIYVGRRRRVRITPSNNVRAAATPRSSSVSG